MVPIFVAQISNNTHDIYTTMGQDGISAIGEMTSGEVSQELDTAALGEKLSQVGVYIGTYQRANHAEYQFILQEDGEDIVQQTFSATNLEDSTFQVFRFAPVELQPGSTYHVVIKALNATEGDAITLFRDVATGKVVVNVREQSDFNPLIIILALVFLAIFLLINVFINVGILKSERSFFVCFMVYALAALFIYPPFAVPDEPYHFISTVRVTEYDPEISPAENRARQTVTLPANAECLSYSYLTSPDLSGKVSPQILHDCFLDSSDEPTHASSIGSSKMKTRGSLGYFGAVLGVALGDWLSDSPMIIFYFGRVFNFLLTVGILFFATSLLKKEHRMIFLAVIMIPVFLQQTISYSYDGPLNALCLLIIAYGIRFLTTNYKARVIDIIILIVALGMISIIKPPYVVVAAPLLFVDAKKFGQHKFTKWILLGGLAIVSLVPYFLDGYFGNIGQEHVVLDGIEERGLPMETLLHPRFVAKMFLGTFYYHGAFWLKSMIGFFAWFAFSLDQLLIVAYYIFLIIVTLSRSGHFSKGMRIFSVCAFTILVFALMFIMYLEWTLPGEGAIDGIQGRYFLPGLPLLMFAFMPQQKKLNVPDNTCYSFMSLIATCFIVTILVGFY